MSEDSDYPASRNDAPHEAIVASALASATESRCSIARMNEQPTTNYMAGKRPRLSIRRARDPPKNNDGQIYCDHPDCQGAPPTFRRPCEWNKHMDRHDRPYKCDEPGCVMNRGFTYSGGLLRHQREVHKKHADDKKLLMCPYGDCNRSTGNGFARRENLHEHMRRRHMHKNDGGSRFVGASQWDRAKCLPAGRTRRHHDSPNGEHHVNDKVRSELRNEVERLRHEVDHKSRRLEELEQMIVSLQQPIPQLPQLQYQPEPIEQTVSLSQTPVGPAAPTVKDFTADEDKEPGRIAGELKDQCRLALEAYTRCFTTALGIAKTGTVKQATEDFVFCVSRSSIAARRSPHPEGSVRRVCLLLGQYLEALMEMIQQARCHYAQDDTTRDFVYERISGETIREHIRPIICHVVQALNIPLTCTSGGGMDTLETIWMDSVSMLQLNGFRDAKNFLVNGFEKVCAILERETMVADCDRLLAQFRAH